MNTLFKKSMLSRMVLVLGLGLGAVSTQSLALDVAGVSYAPQTQASGTVLQLTGAGIRRQASNAMYTAALYLEKKQSTAESVIKDSGAKQLKVVFLRDVNSREIGDMLARGLVTNSSDDELANLIPEIVELGNLIAERGKLYAGDSFQIDWGPTVGTTITVRERGQAKPVVQAFAKPDLIGAMMRIWLGNRPADPELKSALLGS